MSKRVPPHVVLGRGTSSSEKNTAREPKGSRWHGTAPVQCGAFQEELVTESCSDINRKDTSELNKGTGGKSEQ